MTELTLDHVNAFFAPDLFDADPRFERVLSADLVAGEGTYQATGEATPQAFMFDEVGKLLAPVNCDAARTELRTAAAAASAAPPDPYAAGLAAMRAASVSSSTDRRNALAAKLRNVVSGSVWLVDVNDDGTGTYQTLVDGKKITRRFKFDPDTLALLTPTPEGPANAVTVAEGYAPPDPYAQGLAAMRAANAAPESSFEADYKQRRSAELGVDANGLRAASAEPELTPVKDLSAYAPPNPYGPALKALKGATK